MCGLVGIISGANTKRYEDIFYQGLILDTIRGKHSTGAAIVQDCDAMYHKNAIPGSDFVETSQFHNMIRNTALNKPVSMLGHNRSATMGKVNKANSHPFEIDNILGMHNGTLRKTGKLDSIKFDTDSEALFNHIQKHGVNDALNKAEGAYCLVWFDSQENKVFFVRNNERPLFFAKEKDTDTLFYGSEAEMLWWLCNRNNVNIESTYQIETETLYTFDLGAKQVSKPYVHKMRVESEYPAYPQEYWGYGNTHDTYNTGQHNKGKNNKNKSFNSTEELKKMGFKKDDKIKVAVFDHKPYTNHTDKGKVEAFMVNSPWTSVTIHGVSEDLFIDIPDVVDVYINSLVELNGDKSLLCSLPQGYDDVQDITSRGINYANSGGPSQKKLNGPEFYKGPDGIYVTKDEVELRVLESHGCGMCGDDIPEEDYDNLEWHGNTPICPFCVEEWKEQFLG